MRSLKRLQNTVVRIFPRNDYLWEGENDGDWIYVDPVPEHGNEKTHNHVVHKLVA